MKDPDLDRLAHAIAFHESEHNDFKVGPSGARGRYQLQAQLWAQITHEPFERAHDYPTAHAVMIRHLRWLRAKLRRFRSLERSRVGLIALGWTAGPQAVLFLFATPQQKNAADLIEKTYERNAENLA